MFMRNKKIIKTRNRSTSAEFLRYFAICAVYINKLKSLSAHFKQAIAQGACKRCLVLFVAPLFIASTSAVFIYLFASTLKIRVAPLKSCSWVFPNRRFYNHEGSSVLNEEKLFNCLQIAPQQIKIINRNSFVCVLSNWSIYVKSKAGITSMNRSLYDVCSFVNFGNIVNNSHSRDSQQAWLHYA